MKRILILTAGYGEGHNAAARGLRDGLARVAPAAVVEVHDLFAETYGPVHELLRKGYVTLINRWPEAWGAVYRWLDGKTAFDAELARFFKPLKNRLAWLLGQFTPDVIVSVFPPYPYLLEQIAPNHVCRSIAVVTDSITINAIWYRSRADYFLLPNEQSAQVVRAAGVSGERIRVFGFPVSPRFAELWPNRMAPATLSEARVLYMLNAGTARAPEIVSSLLDLGVRLTVTVGRDEKLRGIIAAAARGRPVDILGWTDQLPELLSTQHLLIGKAGGATVQETIAAGCPMIITHIVSGQEQGNAQLIVQSRCGTIALSAAETLRAVERAFADGATQWWQWSNNIAQLSRPRAALDIAEFLISL